MSKEKMTATEQQELDAALAIVRQRKEMQEKAERVQKRVQEILDEEGMVMGVNAKVVFMPKQNPMDGPGSKETK